MKDIARFLKVLSDEARLQMLWLLLHHQELCVCDIMAALGITQSKASRHLATLRHAGLVADRKDGLWSFYSLRPPRNDLERAVLDTLRARLADRPDAGRVLRSLHSWLARKERVAACEPDGACGPVPRAKTSNRARQARSGGKR